MDVRIEHLRFERAGALVLSIDELDFPAGNVTAVLGPNGAGKTTLLRIISGLERPTKGRALLGGEEVRGPARAVAFAFQTPVFVEGSAAANIELGLRLRDVPKSERKGRVEEVAKMLAIEGLLGRSARSLSRGEAQRVNLARALVLRAPVTLLDEPLAAVDIDMRESLLKELPRLFSERGTTAIVVTHDREEARLMAERQVILDGGRVRSVSALPRPRDHFAEQ